MLYFLLKVLKEEITFLCLIQQNVSIVKITIYATGFFFFLSNSSFEQREMFPVGQMRILNLIYYLRDVTVPSKH